jgi:hypothetical protein
MAGQRHAAVLNGWLKNDVFFKLDGNPVTVAAAVQSFSS